ncbi:hypothetical protein B7486_31475 [cyanobacterium TDX16]|nr:hypothetical protein B7486_31475 [cyanobacterium TDX16]
MDRVWEVWEVWEDTRENFLPQLPIALILREGLRPTALFPLLPTRCSLLPLIYLYVDAVFLMNG